MNIQRLAHLIQRPEVHRRILAGYAGSSYSIGVTPSPSDSERLAIRVRIEGTDLGGIPSEIGLDGEFVPIIVSPQFVPPVPLPLRVRR
jgi:hypothetical protein